MYTARLGADRDYLFAAGYMGGVGVRVYDMTTIAGFGSACLETTPSTMLCGNAYVGSVGPSGLLRASAVHGVGQLHRHRPQTTRRPAGSTSTTSGILRLRSR